MLKVFLISFVGSLLATWIAMNTAKLLDIVDRPGGRKIHSKPVPLMGGLAVFTAFAVALLLNFRFSIQLKGVVIGGFFLMAAGLVDDIKDLSASARLLIQVLCCLLVVSFGVRLNIIPDQVPGAFAIESLITILWIVGITNALNFMDGMDGLAAGISIIAAGTFFFIAYRTGQQYFAYLNVALVGACLGFLVFNFKPARIFLGDSGSSFLGFTIASLAVMGEWAERKPVIALGVPVLVLALLIFDMIYISISRIATGKVRTFRGWLEYVGRDHLHHRLVSIGFTQVETVFFIYFVSMIFSLGALVLGDADPLQAVLLLCQGVFILVALAILMIAGKGSRNNTELTGDG